MRIEVTSFHAMAADDHSRALRGFTCVLKKEDRSRLFSLRFNHTTLLSLEPTDTMMKQILALFALIASASAFVQPSSAGM